MRRFQHVATIREMVDRTPTRMNHADRQAFDMGLSIGSRGRGIATASTTAPCLEGRRIVFDPDANLQRINRAMVYLGACLIAGMRVARERSVNVRLIPTSDAIDDSVDLAREILNRVFRKVPQRIEGE